MKVTIADVARAAGVSSQTVSRVINNKSEISPETRRSVSEVIKRLGYRPSSIARSLATRRTNTLGLVLSDIANPFWSEVARGIEDVAWERGYHVFFCNTTEEPRRERAVIELLEDKRVDGLVLAGSRLPDEELLPLLRKHPAAVLVNRVTPDNLAGSARVDSAHGAAQATRHLLAGGRRMIAFLAGPTHSQNSKAHLRGYTSTLQKAGLPCDDDLIVPCSPTIEGGHTAAAGLLARRPDVEALYCYNDLVAVGALQACAERQISVPGDLAVVGYDDILLASLLTPQLSSVRVPKYDLGASAARLLFERIGGQGENAEIVLLPELVVRRSSP
jgi:LacI family transcriptional regulator